MKRRQFIVASAAAIALPSLARGEKNSVLKFVPGGEPASLDPIATTSYDARSHAFMVYDTLYGQAGADQGFAAKPQMVAGHTVENDGKTWSLTLRDGLVFHDGVKVLARDCVASIRRWSLMQRTDELMARDDRAIVFRLNRPFAMLPDALGKFEPNMCAIMPERLAITDPFKQVTEIIGSGPFRFKADERVAGSLYVYERFDGYKPRDDGQASFVSGPKVEHFDRVEWHINPDQTSVVAALQAGEIGWDEFVLADLLPMLTRDSRITVQRAGSSGGRPLAFAQELDARADALEGGSPLLTTSPGWIPASGFSNSRRRPSRPSGLCKYVNSSGVGANARLCLTFQEEEDEAK